MFLGGNGHRVAIALAVVLALISVLVCGAIWFGYLPTTRALEAESQLTQVEAELTQAQIDKNSAESELTTAQSNWTQASLAAQNAQATATALSEQLSECERKLTSTPMPESRGEGLFAGVGAGAEISGTYAVTDTYPVLTMEIVQPLIDAMGDGGHAGHDVAGNEQCAYWLDSRYLPFADDSGPNTSGIEQTEGVFRFDLAGIARYKNLPPEAVFVIEAAWASYQGQTYEQFFVLTTGRDTIDVSGAAIFALPPASVEPFLALRVAHLACRGYQDGVVDFRSGKAVVTTPTPTKASPPASTSTSVPTTPTLVPPSAVVSFSFAGLAGSVASGECVSLEGKSGQLTVTVSAGSAFATSGRESEATDWLIATGATSVTKAWTGWWICAGQTADAAASTLVANDPNAGGNTRVTW